MRAGVLVDWLPGVRYYWALAARGIFGASGDRVTRATRAGDGQPWKGRSNDNSALGVEIITSGLFPDSISTHQSRRAGSGAYPRVHVPIGTWQFSINQLGSCRHLHKMHQGMG